jgi:cytochrome c-type protein NapC
VSTENPDPGVLGRLWTALRQPSAKYSLLTLLVVGFFSGIVFWGGFNTAMEATNTLEFCVSCHEMRDTVYQEYKKTVHYQNRTGVRAICSDCHVPKDWVHKMARKIQASGELYGKLMGTIDTPEKFEAKRLELAQHEWKRMKDADSRECRNCHSFDGMNTEVQKQRARKQHELAQRDKETCIDCHKGIAHQKPKGMKEDDE